MKMDLRFHSKLDPTPYLDLLQEIIATGVVVINRPVFEFIVTLAEIRHHGSCVLCGHRSTLDTAALARFGLKPDAPIASFVKRLRCTKCGGGSVMAERVPAVVQYRRRAS
jgi:hypothetical protein